MKVKVKKEEAVLLIPSLTWMKEGVLVKRPRTVDPLLVKKLVAEGREGIKWAMYRTGKTYFVCNNTNHDSWFSAEAK